MKSRRFFRLLILLLLPLALADIASAQRSRDSHAVPTASPRSMDMSEEKLAIIDDVVSAALAAKETSGAVVLVARDGRVVFQKAYGFRSIDPVPEPATLDTIYDVASLTKPVACASAIMKLVEQGKVRLRDSISDYLDEWKPTPDEKRQAAEAAAVKRALRTGRLRISGDLVTIDDAESTVPEGTPETTVGDLFKRMLSKGEVRPSPRAVAEMIQFYVPDREEVTLAHLLTHTSGLDPFDRYYLKWPEGGARSKIIADIARRKLLAPPGQQFIYSDLGYITLGQVVERVAGIDLNTFCQREIFGPLGMTETMFNPPEELRPRIAPTEWRDVPSTATGGKQYRYMLRGEVHDGNAWVQDGISGHAGLFSTIRDLAIFCQMMLAEGTFRDTRILSPVTVRAMTTDQVNLGHDFRRGYGWDIGSSYSSQRGDIFQSGYGHTGWTGTSIWIVPEEHLFFIILSNRVHPDGSGNVVPLRAKIANAVAGSITKSHRDVTLE